MFKININLIIATFVLCIETGVGSIRRFISMRLCAKIKIVRAIQEWRGEVEETEFLV